jgi:methylthioribose-1-phosphate isomerase
MRQIETLHWVGGVDGHLEMIDQTLLPVELKEIACRNAETVWEAIKTLRVRGAPAIGIAAAYGVCLGLQTVDGRDEAAFFARLDEVAAYLAGSRPTAVNLFWALDRMKKRAASLRGERPSAVAEALLAEAEAIRREDHEMCRAMGRHGAMLLSDGQGVLTHCNAGGLACGGSGLALAVLYAAAESGKTLHVYADETRPLLQGARLTAWELQQRDIDVTLICDSMAAQVMREDRVQAVVTGADRIAATATP